MARRSDVGKHEEIWSAEDVKEIARNLAGLSEPAAHEGYWRACRECAIITPAGSNRRVQSRNWYRLGSS
jgi:hypothetical protein